VEEVTETQKEITKKAEQERKDDKVGKEGQKAPLGAAELSNEKGDRSARSARFKLSPGQVRWQSQPGHRRV
jgi:hypothetical protein